MEFLGPSDGFIITNRLLKIEPVHKSLSHSCWDLFWTWTPPDTVSAESLACSLLTLTSPSPRSCRRVRSPDRGVLLTSQLPQQHLRGHCLPSPEEAAEFLDSLSAPWFSPGLPPPRAHSPSAPPTPLTLPLACSWASPAWATDTQPAEASTDSPRHRASWGPEDEIAG